MNWDDCIDHTSPPVKMNTNPVQVTWIMVSRTCALIFIDWKSLLISRAYFQTMIFDSKVIGTISVSDPPCIVDDRNECWLKTGKDRHDVSVGPWLRDPRVCIDHSTSQAKGWYGSFPDRIQVLTHFEISQAWSLPPVHSRLPQWILIENW